MDWLTFFSEVIGDLAWPTAIGVGIWVLRRPLGSLVPRLEQIKYKKLTIKFTRQVRAVKAEVDKSQPSGTLRSTSKELANPADWLFEIAASSPRLAIAAAWREVELAANEAIRVKEGELVRGEWVFPVGLARQLGDRGILDEDMLRLFIDLHQLRNNAVHDDRFTIDREAVEEYIQLATTLSYFLYGSTVLEPGQGPLAQAGRRQRTTAKKPESQVAETEAAQAQHSD